MSNDYPKNLQQEDLSRSQFSAHMSRYGWVDQLLSRDLGEDMFIRIYDNGESTGLQLYIQLKSIKEIGISQLKNGDISYQIQTKHLSRWEKQISPVFVVIWDIEQKMGWWTEAKAEIDLLDKNNNNWRQKNKVNIRIPNNKILNEKGVQEIRRITADRFYPVVAKDKTLIIEAKFLFPLTAEGQEKREEFETHINIGDPVELDGQYIMEFKPSEWFTRIYGPIDPQSMYLAFGPTTSSKQFPAEIDFISPGFYSERISVEFHVDKVGQKQVILSAKQPNSPFLITLIINTLEKTHQFSISIHYGGIDALTAGCALRVHHILSKGGEIRVRFLTVEDELRIPVPNGSFEEPSLNVIQLIDNIERFQQRTGLRIQFSEDGSFTNKDVIASDELVSILDTGQSITKGKNFGLSLKRPAIQIISESWDNNKAHIFQLTFDESYEDILATRIQLGPLIKTITGYWRMSTEEVLAWLEKADSEDSMIITLENAEILEEFPRCKNGMINLPL